MAKIVIGMGYGDEGKGTIVDFLARQEDSPVTVIRFNGGAQAAHNVVDPRGDRHHTFAQFGSGTLAGARTHLSRFTLVDPFALHAEAVHLSDIMGLTLEEIFHLITIDRECVITTPFHIAANRIREVLRNDSRHGSCGMGIHETVADHEAGIYITAGELEDHQAFAAMTTIRLHKLSQFTTSELDEAASRSEDMAVQVKMLRDETAPGIFLETMRVLMLNVHLTNAMEVGVDDALIFEGAQGVLLDQHHGQFPYVTHSTTTFKNALTLLDEMGYEGEIERIGVTRPYLTRHGRGPFRTEDSELTALLPDAHNGNGEWQEGFRVGHFDIDMAQYAAECCGGVDSVAVTCLDRIEGMSSFRICHDYGKSVGPHYISVLPSSACEIMTSAFRAPVCIKSYGPRHTDKVECGEEHGAEENL